MILLLLSAFTEMGLRRLDPVSLGPSTELHLLSENLRDFTGWVDATLVELRGFYNVQVLRVIPSLLY